MSPTKSSSTLKHVELIDADKMRKLMANWDLLPLRAETMKSDDPKWDPRKICESYIENADNNRVEVRYKKSKTSDGSGRWFAKGLQSLPREIRHTIAGEFYRDIDMKNAHPVLLQQYCQKAGIPCPCLTDYVLRRDEIFREVGQSVVIEKEEIKRAFLALTNGGRGNSKVRGHPVLMRYKKEMDAIHADIVAREPRFVELVQKKGKETNQSGSAVNMLLCDLENKVLMAIVDYLKMNEIATNNLVLVFDGIMIPKAELQDLDLIMFLEAAANHAFEKTGYKVTLVEKPMSEAIDLNALEDRRNMLPMKELAKATLEEHDELAKVATDLANGRIAFCGTQAFVFNTEKGRWVEDAKNYVEVKRFLLDCVSPAIHAAADAYNAAWRQSQSEELSKCENGLRKHAMALKNARHLPRIIEMMAVHLQMSDIRERLDANPYLLGFTNGVFDLRTGEFEKARPDHMVSLCTGYDYSESVSAEATALVHKFLDEIFGSADEKDYLLKILASCLDGTRRFEEFYILTGAGRNGKGTLMTLLNRVLRDYYADMAAEFWTRPRKDSSAPLPELVNKVGRRVCNSSEPEAGDAPLQAAKLKMFSGRDPVSCRQLYGEDFSYMPQFGIFIQTNDIPTLNKVDQGVSNRLRIIQFPHQFVADPVLPHQRKQDPALKERFQNDPQVRNALLGILIENYKTVSQMDSIPMPQRFKNVCKEYIDESNPVIQFLQENYTVTNKMDDFISAADMWNDFAYKNKNYTQTMFGRLMEAAGLVKATVRVNGKNTRAYKGIKRRSNDESDTDE